MEAIDLIKEDIALDVTCEECGDFSDKCAKFLLIIKSEPVHLCRDCTFTLKILLNEHV